LHSWCRHGAHENPRAHAGQILIDIAAVFVYDMGACRSTGCAWGTPGDLTDPRHIPTGALFEKLHDAGYPADIELI
jgi:hypothetical protein